MRYNTVKKRFKIKTRIKKYLVIAGYSDANAEKLVNWWIDGVLPEVYREDVDRAKLTHEYELKCHRELWTI